jgi:hypothetical protein
MVGESGERAGWKSLGSNAPVAASFEEETEAGDIRFTIEFGHPSHYMDERILIDTSRITFIPQDDAWEPRYGHPNVSVDLRKLFGNKKETGAPQRFSSERPTVQLRVRSTFTPCSIGSPLQCSVSGCSYLPLQLRELG